MAEPPVLLLVHSPLVGPLSWQPAGDRLRDRGYPVVVPSLAGVTAAGPPYHRRLVDAAVASVDTSRPVVVVGHSGAGPLLPAIAGAVGDAARAAVYVDAMLPHPGRSTLDAVPAAVREQLLGLAVDGRLPRWHEWFAPEAFAALVPDAGLRARLVAEIEELPLAYLAEPAPAADTPAGCAYVQLSDAYQDAADAAERRGWPTYRCAADHLAVLTRPELVAGRLDTAVRSVAGGAAAGSGGSGTTSGS